MVAKERCENLNLGRFPGEMAEISLLLPSWQMEALESAACAEGMTVGQYLRRTVLRAINQHAHESAASQLQ